MMRRRMGTGSLCCVNGRWYAYGPEHLNKRECLGGFEHRRDAEKFLDAWVQKAAASAEAEGQQS